MLHGASAEDSVDNHSRQNAMAPSRSSSRPIGINDSVWSRQAAIFQQLCYEHVLKLNTYVSTAHWVCTQMEVLQSDCQVLVKGVLW